jgi:hypothetical protein
LVDQLFNDCTGTGEHGEIDTRGLWNESNSWVFTDSPAIQAEAGASSAIDPSHVDKRVRSFGDDAFPVQLRVWLKHHLHAPG